MDVCRGKGGRGGRGEKEGGKEREGERCTSSNEIICVFLVSTIAKMAAISLECPNGSICQATRGLASAPKLSSTNFTPKTPSTIEALHHINFIQLKRAIVSFC